MGSASYSDTTKIIVDKVYTKRKPSAKELSDVAFGYDIAIAYRELDTGSCVIIKKKCIMAVEACEGINGAISRGAILTTGKAVVTKIASSEYYGVEKQPLSLDTFETMAKYGASVIAFKSDELEIINIDECISFANKNKLTIFSINVDNI